MILGLFAFAAAVVSVTIHVWLARGVLVPITGTSIEYLFVSSTRRSLVVIAIATAVLLVAGHLLLRWRAARRFTQPALFSWSDVAYLAPLCWFAIGALPLLTLIRSMNPYLSVLTYVIVDMRWWWIGLVLAWTAWRLAARFGAAWRERIGDLRPFGQPPTPPGGTEVAGAVSLAALAVVWAVAGTPVLRSDGGATGDEPKYLRYCENWYQGLGLEVTDIKPMAELPADFRPRILHNATMLAAVLPGELRSLIVDVGRFVRDPSQPFNRARHTGGGFVAGKNGGMYQMHNPGISAVIFPAYVVDRQLSAVVPGSKAQWPEHLPVVNTLMLAVYAAWTILIFRFLRKCGASAAIAWVTTLACTFTLPAAAFPFQYYPELVAGLIVTAVAHHLLFGDDDTHRRSFVFGLLAGYLVWLHVRFSAVTMVFACAPIVLWRGDHRRTIRFLAGVAVPVALFSLYIYRVSGSVMPSALWTASGDENNFAWLSMIRNSSAYLVDRDWGLFAHSPVFLLALPGYWWTAKRLPRVAALSALIFFALLLPAAGKTLVQTTPLRLILAVVPLAATPMIEVLERHGRATWFVFALLLILSLDNALAYNFHHDRTMDLLNDPGFSGWKVNLLFPHDSRQPWQSSMANGILLIVWLAAIAALLIAPAFAPRLSEELRRGKSAFARRLSEEPRRGWPAWNRSSQRAADPRRAGNATSAVVTAIIFLAVATAVAAATGAWTWRKYLMTPPIAGQAAARQLDDLGHCVICFSSTRGPIGRHDAVAGARRLVVDLESIDPAVGDRRRTWSPRYSEWVEMPGRVRAWYVEANGREPSAGEVGHFMYLWHEERLSDAQIRKRIFESAGKTPP